MLPLIAVILAAAGGLTLVVLALLNWDRIIDWFRGRQELKQSDKDNIAFTLQEKIANGNYKTIEGIFNKKTNVLLDGVQYESEKIDEKLADVHRNEPLVVYE